MSDCGTLSSYARGGCRCDECRAAGTAARRRLRERAGAVNPHVRAARRLADASQEARLWIDRAACAGSNVNVFFVADTSRGEQYAEARAICRGCPVTAECLEWSYSSAATQEFGFFGGMSPRERRQAKRKRKIA